jgi:hypothetical protein
MGDDSTPLHSR